MEPTPPDVLRDGKGQNASSLLTSPVAEPPEKFAHYHPVVFGNTTFLINPKIHFHYDNSMIVMDISGKGQNASSLLTSKVAESERKPEKFGEEYETEHTIDLSGQYIHSYHDVSGQHIHTYTDSSGLHIHSYMDNIHPYHDISGWHLPYYRDDPGLNTTELHMYPYHDAWGWHMLPSRDIGWHIHPYDGSDNIIHDASGWHFKPPPDVSNSSTRVTVLHLKTTDASLNWYYFHHGHPVDLSMTDISGITPKSIHIYQYDYPYPSSTLLPNSSGGSATFEVSSEEAFCPLPNSSGDIVAYRVSSEGGWKPPLPATHHHYSVSEYYNELIHDIHKIMLGDVPTIFEFPTDFIPDVSIPSICTYTSVSTSIIDSEPILQIDNTTTEIDSEGNQTTCDISASIIDISGSEPILQIENTTTEIDSEGNIIHQTSCDISASVIDISGSEPILNVDITDTSGNQSSYDISASKLEYDASGNLQFSSYTIDCSTNSIQVMLSDFGNNLPPYVVYICDVCAKAKLSTP